MAERQGPWPRIQDALAFCIGLPVFWVSTLAAAVVIASVCPGCASAAPKASVLLLNSYHKGLDWTDDLTDGVSSVLKDHHLYVEYMDTKRHADERYLELLRGLLLKKYQTDNLDVIISSDDHALAFLLRNRNNLFTGVPIVFCGVNNYSPELIAGHKRITGVVEAFDIGPTIDMALRLHPKTRKVVVVNDTTKTGQANKAVIEKLLPAFSGRTQFEFLETLTMPDLLARVGRLPPQALVLMMSYNRDAAGQVFDYDTGLRMVADNSPVPIYGVWDFYLGSGIVGGKLTSGRVQGEMAANMAQRIIDGTDADDISVVTQSPNRWMFDHRQLVRFKIDDSRLPADSVVVNRPRTLYQQHKGIVWGSLAVIAALTLLSGFLMANIQRRRKTERDLRESRLLIEGIAANVPGVLYQFYAAAGGRYGLRFVGPNAKTIFGLDADPDTFFEAFCRCLPAIEVTAFMNSIADAAERVADWHYEGRFIRPDNGDTLWFSGNSVPHREDDTVVFDGVLMDISDIKATEEKLRRSEQQMSQIIDFLPDPTFVIDLEGRVIAWNRAMEKLSGIDAKDMLGTGNYEYAKVFYGERRPVMIDLVADWNAETAAKYIDVEKRGEVLISETKEAHRPLGDRHFKNTAGPLYDENGTVVGAIETIHDITDRKKAQEEIHKRQMFLESVLYHAPDAIIILDAHHRVTDWNKGAEQIFGYLHNEALGRELDGLVARYDARLEAGQKTSRVLSGQRVESFETVRYRKDGTPVNVIAGGSPILVDGELTGVVAMYTDITALKRAEMEVRRNARMLRRIIDMVPSMIFVRNAKGRFLMANKAVADSYGTTVEEIVGKRHQDIHPDPEQVERFLADDQDALESGRPVFIPAEPYLDSSGATRWLEVVKMPCDEADFGEPTIVGLATDISHRREAEARIQESEKRYRSVFENTGTGTVLSEADTTLSMVNEEFATMVGYTRAEIEGKMRWTRFIVPEDVERMLGYHTARRENSSRVPTQWECSLVDRAGNVKRMLLKVSLIPGTATSIGAFLDISDRKQAEEAILEANRMLRLVLDTIPVRVFWKDQAGRYLGCNQAFSHDAGLPSPDDLIGKDDYAFPWAKDQADIYRQDDRAVMASGKARINYEEPQTTPDGQTIWLQTSKVPIHDGADNVIGVLGTYMDITARKRSEEEIQKLRNYLSNIIDSMPSILIGVDASGRVTQWNRQAERVTGISSDEAHFRPLQAVFPRLSEEMALINQAIRNREVIRDPKMARREDGETRFEEVTVFPLVTSGVDGAVIRLDDITERVHLEEMMIQSEKMLSVGGLAAGMAHEINNPLAGILQNAAVLRNRLLADLPANRKAAETAGTTMEAIKQYFELRNLPNMLNNIHTSGNRAADIVKNMLSFARKSDRMVSSHDLATLLDQTIELARTDYDMKKRYDFKQIEIVRNYDEAIGPVPCEASKIQQVFLNILKNGAEAMGKATRGSAQPTFVLNLKSDGPWARIEIEDNGPGMGAQTHRRIFEPFFTTKPVGEGTGLGLSVSYFIITENHGGRLDVTPADSGGTRFVIRLPKTGKP